MTMYRWTVHAYRTRFGWLDTHLWPPLGEGTSTSRPEALDDAEDAIMHLNTSGLAPAFRLNVWGKPSPVIQAAEVLAVALALTATLLAGYWMHTPAANPGDLNVGGQPTPTCATVACVSVHGVGR